MVQHRAILTIADQSNGAIFNDLERPLPPVSSHAFLWCWISRKR